MMIEKLKFEEELRAVINRHSKENSSNTPDFILAQYLLGCLNSFDTAVQQRETWYGRDARPNEIIDHIQQEKEYHLNKGNVELKPTKEMLDIRSILEKTLIEAGQRRTIYNGCYLKLNLDTFKWFINQAEQKISSLIKKGKK